MANLPVGVGLLEWLDKHGSAHYNQFSSNVIHQFSLSGLVNNGYVEAFGSREWEKAQFKITESGRAYLKQESKHGS